MRWRSTIVTLLGLALLAWSSGSWASVASAQAESEAARLAYQLQAMFLPVVDVTDLAGVPGYTYASRATFRDASLSFSAPVASVEVFASVADCQTRLQSLSSDTELAQTEQWVSMGRVLLRLPAELPPDQVYAYTSALGFVWLPGEPYSG